MKKEIRNSVSGCKSVLFTPKIAGDVEDPFNGFDNARMTVDLKIPLSIHSNIPRFEDLYKYPRTKS